MKKQDLIFVLVVLVIILPFFLSSSVFNWYQDFNATHGMIMAFIKFAILSTIGEMIGARISSGNYMGKGFGLIPRMVVWGVLGVFINGAFIVFSNGIPTLLEYLGLTDATQILGGVLSWKKVLVALCVSVAMNSFFAPVFMTFHKITDTHIHNHQGSIKSLFTPIPMKQIMTNLNWGVQWGFVFKKTIPFFWYPAHTITFLLPQQYRVLFAALLGVALGIILAVAARKK